MALAIFISNQIKSINPFSSYIKPQITPPSPLDFAILNGGSKRRIILADLGSPRGKPAENTRHLAWRVGGGRSGEVGLAHFLSRSYYFALFSEVT
jgi:hypothetical protein